jgi:UDP-N-acetyl-D-mannosaminuronate dehydrogenase
VCEKLAQMGATVEVFDPMFAGEKALGFDVKRSLVEAVRGADCIVIGTAHKEFKGVDLGYLATLVNGPAALVDSRNVVDPLLAAEAGFAYRGVGRPASPQTIRAFPREQSVATSVARLG